MGLSLWQEWPLFGEWMERCEQALSEHVEWSLREVLSDEQALEQVDVVQPALWAVMVSLAECWRAAGVEPAAVIGHSQGEIAAAVISGALSLEEGAKVVALRSKAITKLAGKGGMVAVNQGAEELEPLLERIGELSIAAQNSSHSTVVSGAPAQLEELLSACEAEGVRARRIAVDYASHSPQVQELQAEIEEALSGLDPKEPKIALASTKTGALLADAEPLDESHWYEGLRHGVRFSEAIESLLAEEDIDALIEVSAHPVMAIALEQCAPEALVLATLKRDDDSPRRLTTALAHAHVNGVEVEWAALIGPNPPRTPLPTYPFQHQRYWLEAATGGADLSSAGLHSLDHPLLAASVPLAAGEGALLTGRLSLQSHPWLAGHAVHGTVLLPGTALLELALQAGAQLGLTVVEELTLEAPLPIPEEGAVEIQVIAGQGKEDGSASVEIHARAASSGLEREEWVRHASGCLSVDSEEMPVAPDSWPPTDARPIDVAALNAQLEAAGFAYGPPFQGLRSAWRGDGELFCEVALDQDEGSGFALHPALLDAALHPALADEEGKVQARLPFAWSGVRLAPRWGSAELRVRIEAQEEGALRVSAFSPSGEPILLVRELAARPLDPSQLRDASSDLLEVEWVEVAAAGGASAPDAAAVDMIEIAAPEGDAPGGPREALADALDRVRAWLDEHPTDGQLLIHTSNALAARPGEVPDLRLAPAWGLLRSAQAEYPERLVLVDTPDPAEIEPNLAAILASEEPQLALREGTLLAPRLIRARPQLQLPEAADWHLVPDPAGALDALRIAECEPLSPGPGEVLLGVRAAAINFRDVLMALGMYPGPAVLGSDVAGVVLETGEGVDDLAPGDRVLGLAADTFAPRAIADRRTLAPIPEGMGWSEAASTPTAWLTALYGLVDLAGLTKGERVLIHAGSGGVGQAAVQLAAALGAEVFATASPQKWGVLRELGLDEEQIASSRDLDFAKRFGQMDVVLNSLAGEFTDASLALLGAGGRFVEMGKTNIREAQEVQAEHPGVSYRAFDLIEAGPERIGEMLEEVLARIGRKELTLAPVRAWDLREAGEAMRLMSQARHTGKLALTIPQAPTGEGTALISGATSGLGAQIARHLARTGQAKRLILISRRGPEAPGASELLEELSAMGCEAEVVACDVADRQGLAALLEQVGPLTAIYHAAGVLEDATIAEIEAGQVDRVLAPKVSGAWNLHQLTAGMDLEEFVLCSSAAGVLGGPGQGAYAAANAFLDALAQQRASQGLSARSLAWGLWEEETGMTASLDDAARARLRRTGMAPIATEQGLRLLDSARELPGSALVALPFDRPALRAQATAGVLPPILQSLVRVPPSRSHEQAGSLAARLAAVPEAEREEFVAEEVRSHVAAVLGHAEGSAIDPQRAFKDLGFDSLSAVELRNRLASASGLRLAPTLVFDHPNVAAVAGELVGQMVPSSAPISIDEELDGVEARLVELANEGDARLRIERRMRALLGRRQTATARWRTVAATLEKATADDR